MTKKELQDQYDTARQIIKDLQNEIKQFKVNSGQEADLSLMEDKAISIIRDDEGKYRRIVVAFNAKENVAAIESNEPAARNDKDYSLALQSAKIFLIDNIMKKIRENF